MKDQPKANEPGAVNIGTNLTNLTDHFLTKRELAALAKVSGRTVENWQRDRLLPYIKIGNVVRYERSDVLEHFRKNFRINTRGVPSPKPEIPKL